MKQKFREVWNGLPEPVRNIVRGTGATGYLRNRRTAKMKKAIISDCRNSNDYEKQEIAQWLERNELRPYPYPYVEEYKSKSIDVYRDEDDYPYTFVDGKKLYGRKRFTNKQFAKECVGRLAEQDDRSPHCYVPTGRNAPVDGAVIAELGAAEAAFSLEYIERCKKVYLFECLDEWMIPLQKTFEPWKDKVEIVKKYVGRATKDDFISIDDFFKDKEVNVVKADIEGYEIDMLMGGGEDLLE